MSESAVFKAMKKCKPFQGRRWCGYLLPVDIVALIDAGARVEKYHEYQVEDARKQIEQGIGGGTWFYFELGRLPKKYGKLK
jgi:hypothetical protein